MASRRGRRSGAGKDGAAGEARSDVFGRLAVLEVDEVADLAAERIGESAQNALAPAAAIVAEGGVQNTPGTLVVERIAIDTSFSSAGGVPAGG